MKIISLSNSLGIGVKLANILGIDHIEAYVKIFPDGEIYVRVPVDVKDDVILIQSTYPDQNRTLMELFLGIDAVKRLGGKVVATVIPYLAYSRQDREFLRGEAISSYVILSIIKSLGVKYLVTIDAHSPKLKEYFGEGFINVIPAKLFANYLTQYESIKAGDKNVTVIAPDKGAELRASLLSSELNVDYVVIKKYRDRYTGKIRHEFPEGISVNGKVAVIVDDIISTGGTVANIASFLKDNGAGRVIVVASHGLFVGNAISKLRNSGVDKVVITKTVGINLKSDDLIEVVDPSELIADSLRKIIP